MANAATGPATCLGKRARGEALVSNASEPVVNLVVLNVGRVYQCDEDIHNGVSQKVTTPHA